MTDERRSLDRVEHDKTSDSIRDLIMETPEAKDKAVLMILLKISDDLFRNTQITSSLSDKFEKHVEAFVKHANEEMKMISHNRGFLRGLLLLLTAVQILVGYILTTHFEDFKHIQEDVKYLKIEIEKHKEHHRLEEKFYDKVPKLDANK